MANILITFICSFEQTEMEEILTKLSHEDIDFAPPPLKKAKTEEMSAGPSDSSSVISLTEFLSLPHSKTRYKVVEVSWKN